MFSKNKLYLAITSNTALLLAMGIHSVSAAEVIEEVQVIGITPGSSLGQEINKVPFAVQSANYNDLENTQSLDLSDFMNNNLSSVNINSAQNNPLQPDVQFRGFTASPLLGLSQGLAVYQNGVRINEPLGDSVNWDLLPESAVYSIDLIGGANPIFGLNTLGGALAIDMKDGFNYSGTQIEAYTGSWGRAVGTLESGGNNGDWGYYANISKFDEDGWRDLSKSDALNFYGSISWRNDETSALDVIYQQGKSELIGNGALPVGLLAIQRDAVFTAPDITENDMQMFNIDASHFITDGVLLSGNAFWRENNTDSFNGDGSEFESCDYSGGGQSLFEEADDVEEALEELLDIELDDICASEVSAITNFTDLEELIEAQAIIAGLDPEDFELEDVIDELSGSGIISDEAINNISQRKQESKGINGQVAFTDDFFATGNQLIVGFSYFSGETEFNSVLELAELDPRTRSTRGLGTGTFFDEAATNIYTETETISWFFTDTLDLSEQLSFTVSGRYNATDIVLRDRSGERPELNGDHSFSRFNPALGLTYDVSEQINIYASYSESNRVPTPIELACNEGVFELAQQFAIEDGEDPDDIEFECRLPNAFLADPPLDDVVTKNMELGMRGNWEGMEFQLGLFNATNQDDIIFQTTGRSTGLFANVDETVRWGFESALKGRVEALDWYASYTYLKATFEESFMVLSPNHPSANEEGELAVQGGDRLPGLPESIFKLGGDYHISTSLSIGAELIYNSNQVMRGDESNELDKVDGYSIVNLRASYLVGTNFTAFVRVTNVFDEDYENFGLLGESPAEILPDLTDARPVFLGAGAPRGAWIGVRYSF
ncbi:TonB-dependent receptor [Gammaproteobacteria bacterium]|nr:TonB-dependent receptor [Gammaproteobacteria bacterium]